MRQPHFLPCAWLMACMDSARESPGDAGLQAGEAGWFDSGSGETAGDSAAEGEPPWVGCDVVSTERVEFDTVAACEAVELHDWATYTIVGVQGVDDRLGHYLAAGDLDGDGLDDIVAAGFDAPSRHLYVILGASLSARDPGAYCARDIADRTLIVNGFGTYYNLGLHVAGGELYVGNPLWGAASFPLVYRVPWSSLEDAGTAPRLVEEVAASRMCGAANDRGRSLATCDVNGDGERDLVIAADEASSTEESAYSPSYLVLGPAAVGGVDLDADAVLLYDASDPQDGECRVGACTDLNRDGFDDLGLMCKAEDESRFAMFSIYYGSASFGSDSHIDLDARDVAVLMTSYADEVTWSWLAPFPGELADWTGDGTTDLAVDENTGWPAEVMLFAQPDEGWPRGTVLSRDDAVLRIADAGGVYCCGGGSIAGDLDDDGNRDLVLSTVRGSDDPGAVRIRYERPNSVVSVIDTFGDLIYDGYEPNAWNQAEQLGMEVLANVDTDGDGRDELVIASHSIPTSGLIQVVRP